MHERIRLAAVGANWGVSAGGNSAMVWDAGLNNSCCPRRYGLNVAFNLQNKTIFNFFPYPCEWPCPSLALQVGVSGRLRAAQPCCV